MSLTFDASRAVQADTSLAHSSASESEASQCALNDNTYQYKAGVLDQIKSALTSLFDTLHSWLTSSSAIRDTGDAAVSSAPRNVEGYNIKSIQSNELSDSFSKFNGASGEQETPNLTRRQFENHAAPRFLLETSLSTSPAEEVEASSPAQHPSNETTNYSEEAKEHNKSDSISPSPKRGILKHKTLPLPSPTQTNTNNADNIIASSHSEGDFKVEPLENSDQSSDLEPVKGRVRFNSTVNTQTDLFNPETTETEIEDSYIFLEVREVTGKANSTEKIKDCPTAAARREIRDFKIKQGEQYPLSIIREVKQEWSKYTIEDAKALFTKGYNMLSYGHKEREQIKHDLNQMGFHTETNRATKRFSEPYQVGTKIVLDDEKNVTWRMDLGPSRKNIFVPWSWDKSSD